MEDTQKQASIANIHNPSKTLTFVVTEFCNLSCKYCYEVKKNNKAVMPFEVAKKAVDFILDSYTNESGITFEFIGGEPFLEIDLIDKLCDYIKLEMYKRNHPWFNNYAFSITTNGILYNNPKVQKFINKNLNKLNVTISIDGTEAKHDMQRVKLDGSGSYKDVIKNVELWLKQFPDAQTKVTFASDDLVYLKDSIIHLWNLGIKNVPANVVYEDVWKAGDDLIFEQQMKELADYIIDNNISDEYYCGLFEENIGFPIGEIKRRHNWCTSGNNTLAVDHEGNFYPCIRFMSLSLQNKKPYIIGNIDEGINKDLLRPFEALDIPSQSNNDCINCQVASGCGWCQGFNYDCADSDTIYQRATYLCKMHKARCRANDYYYARLKNHRNYKKTKKSLSRSNFLFILMSNNAVPYCDYENAYTDDSNISFDDFKKAIEYAKENFLIPVIVHDEKELSTEFANELNFIEARHIRPYNHKKSYKDEIVVYDQTMPVDSKCNNSVLIIDNENIDRIPEYTNSLFEKTSRITLIMHNSAALNEAMLKEYEDALKKVSDIIIAYYKKGISKHFSVLTDTLISTKMINCNAGINSITLAPNGKVYLCPAFYFNDAKSSIGNFSDGITIANKQLLSLEKSPICLNCDVYHCKRCIFDNKNGTREFNIPTALQCRISHIERKVSKKLQNEILQLGGKTRLTSNILKDIDYSDPLEIIKEQKLIR